MYPRERCVQIQRKIYTGRKKFIVCRTTGYDTCMYNVQLLADSFVQRRANDKKLQEYGTLNFGNTTSAHTRGFIFFYTMILLCRKSLTKHVKLEYQPCYKKEEIYIGKQ